MIEAEVFAVQRDVREIERHCAMRTDAKALQACVALKQNVGVVYLKQVGQSMVRNNTERIQKTPDLCLVRCLLLPTSRSYLATCGQSVSWRVLRNCCAVLSFLSVLLIPYDSSDQ